MRKRCSHSWCDFFHDKMMLGKNYAATVGILMFQFGVRGKNLGSENQRWRNHMPHQLVNQSFDKSVSYSFSKSIINFFSKTSDCLPFDMRAGSLNGERMRENWKWKTIFTNTKHRKLYIVEPGYILKAASAKNRGVPTKCRFYIEGYYILRKQ